MAIKKGFTLIEVLVVVSLFVVIALITTQSLIRILGSTSNSNSSAVARENIEHAIATMERSIRNANSITSCSVSPMRIEYVTTDNVTENFECSSIGGINTIEQNNQPLISNQINLTTCSLTCLTPTGSTVPNALMIELEGVDAEDSYNTTPVNLKTTILVRSY